MQNQPHISITDHIHSKNNRSFVTVYVNSMGNNELSSIGSGIFVTDNVISELKKAGVIVKKRIGKQFAGHLANNGFQNIMEKLKS